MDDRGDRTAQQDAPGADRVQATRPAARGVARNTAIFSALTAVSRVAGLAREILASAFFGTSAGFSAFTLAFNIPNTVRALFADSALSAAFVPVFTELIEEDRRKEAFRLASTLALLMLGVLGALTVLFVITANLVVPLLVGGGGSDFEELVVGLSQVLFPIVVLLAVNGLAVGILNAHDHFTVPALSPVVWNVVIVVFLVGGHVTLDGDAELYAYAVGIVAGTAAQLAMALPVLRQVGFKLTFQVDLRDPRVRQVLVLMLPVTIGLGLINVNLLINSILGKLVSEEAPRAIDAAFRIYMLPQGIFSVAIATVLFPALSRLAVRRDLAGLRDLLGSGMRQILLTLVPAAVFSVCLAEPITRLVYERGAFDADSTEQVAEALLWFSLSLPLSGINLLLTRTFFSLQQPWVTAGLSALNLGVNVAVSVALYEPFGIAGIVVGTTVANVVMAVAQARKLRPLLEGRLDFWETFLTGLRVLVASLAAFGIAAFMVWYWLDDLLGRALLAQLLSMGFALGVGIALYGAFVQALGVREAEQVRRLVAGRLGRRPRAR
ncbi:murein biosynthesis integral membrane protein MurJ [Conexibacter sp. SYSU D00693]|uniref:murein biosynthesis integral membrane protein MurJ n=1 Tax=Conexibacter sp. SYSU D00693 TaxID=2812560 RepID=UPI00196B97BA|nr:murein biosynthesis integral membrane protein MurJ [Conexibacter sp. SYSU D00693]